MTLSAGERLTLNGVSYQIASYLGGGAITHVYAAVPEGVSVPVAVRLLRGGATAGSPQAAALSSEAELLERLNRLEVPDWPPAGVLERLTRAQATAAARAIVAQLDSGRDELGRPFSVQELAPPPLELFPVATFADEERVMRLVAALCRPIALCHAHGLSLKDFEPQAGKLNRLRVVWGPDGRHLEQIKLIDWNATGGPEGRAQDLFWLGGHLHVLLFGSHAPLSGDAPPADLSLGNRRWEHVSEGARQILGRLLHQRPQRRYQQIAELQEDVARWLELASLPDAAALEQHAWSLTADPERQLAAADLALRRFPEAEGIFGPIVEQARDKLGETLRLLLDPGTLRLRRGDFLRAEQEFERVLADKTLGADLAREARLEHSRARFAQTLQRSGVADPVASSEWRALDDGLAALRARCWPEALAHLAPLAERYGAQPGKGLAELVGLVRGHVLAGLIEDRVGRGLADLAGDWLPTALPDADNLTAAQGYLAELSELVAGLGQEEPELSDLHAVAAHRVARLHQAYEHARELATLVQAAEAAFVAARREWDVARRLELHRHAEQLYQQLIERPGTPGIAGPPASLDGGDLLLSRMQLVQAERLALEGRLADEARAMELAAEAGLLFQQHRYAEARQLVQQASGLAQHLEVVREWSDLIEAAWARTADLARAIEELRELLAAGDWAGAELVAVSLLAEEGRPILPDGLTLYALRLATPPAFRLPDRQRVQRYRSLAVAGQAAQAALREAWSRNDGAAVLAQIDHLEQQLGAEQIGLPARFADERAEAGLLVQQVADDLRWLSEQLAAPRLTGESVAPRLEELRERYATSRVPEVAALREAIARLSCRLAFEEPGPERAAGWLRLALAFIADTSPATRARVSQLCHRLALVVDDLAEAAGWLDRGLMALDRDAAAPALEAERRTLALALELDGALEADLQGGWPPWVGHADTRERLAWLVEAYTQIAPAAEHVRAIGLVLPRWAAGARALAHQLCAQAYERAVALPETIDAEARDLLHAILSLLPAAWQPELQPSLRQRIADLFAAEERARAAHATLLATLDRLAQGELTVRAGVATVGPLVRASSPGQAPSVALELLRQAAPFERLADRQGAASARTIDELWVASGEVRRLGAELTSVASLPADPLEPLRARLAQRAHADELQACGALEELCRRLTAGAPLAEAIGRLVELSLVTRWLSAQPRPAAARRAQEAQVRVGALLEHLVQRSRKHLERARSRDDLAAAEQCVGDLLTLSLRLEEPAPPEALPPDCELAPQRPIFALTTLERYADLIKAIADHPAPQPDHLAGALRRLERLRHAAVELREQVWPSLFQHPWTLDHSIGDLERVAEALQGFGAELVQISSAEAASPLGERIERLIEAEARREEVAGYTGHWLLGADARATLAGIDLAGHALQIHLAQRVDSILGAPYPEAVAQLRQSLLGPVTSPRAVALVTSALVARVEARCEALPAEALSPQSLSGSAEYLWQLLADASGPEPGSPGPAGARPWGGLHQLAAQRRAALAPAPPPDPPEGEERRHAALAPPPPSDLPEGEALTDRRGGPWGLQLWRIGLALALVLAGALGGWGAARATQAGVVDALQAEVRLLREQADGIELSLERLSDELRATAPATPAEAGPTPLVEVEPTP